MFKVFIGLKEMGRKPSLKDATKTIFDWIKKEPTPCPESIWVEPVDRRTGLPIYFKELKSHAELKGWTVNGEWV